MNRLRASLKYPACGLMLATVLVLCAGAWAQEDAPNPEAPPVEEAVDTQQDAPAQPLAVEAVTEPASGEAAAPAPASPTPAQFEYAETAPAPTPHPAPPVKPGYVTNFFYETPLRDVLSEMSLQSGVPILADTSVIGLVTCDLKDLPVRDALKVVLAVGDFTFREMDGFILVGTADVANPTFFKFCDTKVIRLQNINAKEAVAMLPQSLVKMATFNEASNSVIVAAPPEKLGVIEGILKECDQAPGQVVLDVRFVVMETGDLQDVGIQWEWPAAQTGTYSNSELHGSLKPPGNPEWPWGIQLGYTPGKEFTEALAARLNLLVQNEQATIVSNPQVMAQDGKESEVSVTTEEYFEILTQGFYTQSELEKIEVGTKLKITPKLDAGGGITLQMDTEVSDVISRGQGNLPVVTRRKSVNTVRVQDGGTVVVAGLSDNRTRLNEQRVPGIGNAPLVGRAFRNSGGGQTTRQVLIFVTPRLLQEELPVYDAPLMQKIPAAPVDRAAFEAELRESIARSHARGSK